jgi:hypothetical protein
MTMEGILTSLSDRTRSIDRQGGGVALWIFSAEQLYWQGPDLGAFSMATATVEERVTDLERRMSDLEGQVGFLLPLTRQIHRDLLGFKEEVAGRFQAMDAKIDRLEAKMDAKIDRLEAKMDAKFESFEAAMPRAVAETVVELLKRQQR